MREVIKFYRLLNTLSLDVAAGAVVGSLFFAKIHEVRPSVPSLISLGLTVWIIYTVDRLLDGHDVKGQAASERHRFHQRNRKKILYCVLVTAIVDTMIIFFMPVMVIVYGIVLSLLVTVYIILRRHLHISKEILVAVLYTAGVAIPVYPFTQPGSEKHLTIFLFFLIALINLILFSYYDKENDLKDNQNSVATLVNEQTIRKILISLFIATTSITSCLFFILESNFTALIFLVMIAFLLIIFLFERIFAKNDYYRLIGDGVFLLPIIYVIA